MKYLLALLFVTSVGMGYSVAVAQPIRVGMTMAMIDKQTASHFCSRYDEGVRRLDTCYDSIYFFGLHGVCRVKFDSAHRVENVFYCSDPWRAITEKEFAAVFDTLTARYGKGKTPWRLHRGYPNFYWYTPEVCYLLAFYKNVTYEETAVSLYPPGWSWDGWSTDR